MKHSIAYHPKEDLLESFARRGLSTGMSVIISAHVEMCGHCRDRVAEIESRELRDWNAVGETELVDKVDFGDLVERIVGMPRQAGDEASVSPTVPQDRFIKELRLPRALRKSAAKLRWTRLTKGIYQAIVPIDDETRCEFVYMATGASTPPHSHYGREYTLVLQGKFHDEFGSYGNGDFLARDAGHEHQPASDTGCLSFAVLDRPLRFTKGLARLLNPINRLRFRSGLAR